MKDTTSKVIIKSFILDASEKDFHLEINKKMCPKFKKYGKIIMRYAIFYMVGLVNLN